MGKVKDILTILLFIALLYGIAFLAYRIAINSATPRSMERVVIERDTVYLHDTIHIRTPFRLTHIIVDTVYLPTPDTITPLPITQAVYSDSTYRAYVSGYVPRLDSIEIYQRNSIITQTERIYIKPRRLSFGVQAGYGITPKGAQPYIGLGVQYRLY